MGLVGATLVVALATEFLLPCETLRQYLPGTTVSDQDIDELESQLVISSYMIRHQIENHQLAHIIP
jgi:Zn-dependent peptidase ImmA (M78 family)